MNAEPATAITKPERHKVEIETIIRDPQTQPRAKMSQETIERYTEDLKRGDVFPPVVGFHDAGEDKLYLADGWYRVAAHEAAGFKHVEMEVYPGTLRDAILYAASANAAHGMPRTDEDKRRAVSLLLADKEWSAWSDRAIATRAGVSHTLVAKMRQSEDQPAERKVKRGKQTYTMKKKAKKPKAAKPERVDPHEGDRYKRGDIWHTFTKGQWVPDAAPEEVAEPVRDAPWADPDAQRAFTIELGKQPPAAVVGMLVGVMSSSFGILPSPENSAQLLRTRSVQVNGQTLIQVARWFEGIAFALDRQ